MDDFNINEEESFYLSLIIQERQGSISSDDTKKLLEWRNSNPANEVLYVDISQIESNLSLLKIYQHLNTEKSLTALHEKLHQYEAENKPKQKTLKLSGWLAIAASFILVVSSIFYIQHRLDTVTLNTTASETKQFILPDQSSVTLNNNTLITYSKNSFKEQRKLNLIKGECYLDVVHESTKPFSIHYKDFTITDIGTSFNVKLKQNKITVVVNTGKVELRIKNKTNKTYLGAGESASYESLSKEIKTSKILDQNYNSYVNHNFHFNDKTLKEVIETLKNTFYKKILIVDPTIENRRFTAEFKNQNLENILLVISKTLNVKITSKDKIIYITSNK
jgi:transmembrane sensor